MCEEEHGDEGIQTDKMEYHCVDFVDKLYSPFDRKPVKLLKCVP